MQTAESVCKALRGALETLGPVDLAALLVNQAPSEQLALLDMLGWRVRRECLARADRRVNAGMPDPLGRTARRVPPVQTDIPSQR